MKILIFEFYKDLTNIILILAMVLPLFKVLSLVLRVFSKPVITYIKKVHLKKDAGTTHPFLRKGFIYAGNSYNRFETYINRRFMKI